MTPFPRALWFALIASLVAAPGARLHGQGRNARKPPTRQIFVTVMDESGKPVLDVAGSDFDVSEKGVKRTVVHAGLATNPMLVALMVDTSDAASGAIAHVRAGLLAFLDTLGPEHEVMLITTGRQMRVRLPATTDRKKLKQAADGLFGDGAGTPLIDSLIEVDKRFMSKAEDRWPVFVILTSDGTESSTGADQKEFNQWIERQRYRAATANAIVFKAKGNSGLPELVAMNAASNTGGFYDSVLVSTALPDKFKTLATQMNGDFQRMSSRYQIDFETDTTAQLSNVDVGISREHVKMQVSYLRRVP